MIFLANENIPLKSVRLLRNFEHDIVAIVEDSPGATDEDSCKKLVQKTRRTSRAVVRVASGARNIPGWTIHHCGERANSAKAPAT